MTLAPSIGPPDEGLKERELYSQALADVLPHLLKMVQAYPPMVTSLFDFLTELRSTLQANELSKVVDETFAKLVDNVVLAS